MQPACKRIEIAGGIRRKKSEPHDIELVALPLVGGNEWGPMRDGTNWLDKRVRDLFTDYPTHFIHAPPNKAGARSPFSEKYYKFLYKLAPVDLFVVTPPAQWGMVFTIRTGDAGFTHWLVQQGWPKGIYSRDGRLVRHVDLEGRYIPDRQKHKEGDCRWVEIPTPEEADVFKTLNLQWVDPEKRVHEF